VDAYLNNSTDFAGTGAITDASTQGDYTSVNSAATIVNDADSNLTDTHFNISYAGLTDGDAKSELVFHIGANSGQSLTLELANTSSAALGLSDLSAVS
jgi:flagellin